jgi:hypothetical protein
VTIDPVFTKFEHLMEIITTTLMHWRDGNFAYNPPPLIGHTPFDGPLWHFL